MTLRTSSRLKGFTLIELLVVITIIAALAGISYTVFLGMRGKGITTECQANLKQIWIHGQEYANDNYGLLPTSGMADDPNTETIDESQGWWVALAPQILDEAMMPTNIKDKLIYPIIFRCPGDIRVQHLPKKDMPIVMEQVSYVSWTDNSSDPSVPNSPIHTGRGQMLSGLPWLTDGVPVDRVSVKNAMDFEQQVVPVMDQRHGENLNVLYADGHQKSYEMPTFKKVAPALVAPTKKRE